MFGAVCVLCVVFLCGLFVCLFVRFVCFVFCDVVFAVCGLFVRNNEQTHLFVCLCEWLCAFVIVFLLGGCLLCVFLCLFAVCLCVLCGLCVVSCVFCVFCVL